MPEYDLYQPNLTGKHILSIHAAQNGFINSIVCVPISVHARNVTMVANFYVMHDSLTSIQSFSYMIHISLDVHYSSKHPFKNPVSVLTNCFKNAQILKS